MTPPAMFAPMFSSYSAPSQHVARPVPSAAQCPSMCCNPQQSFAPSTFRYVHSPYTFSGYETHQEIQASTATPVLPQFQTRHFPTDTACPPFPTLHTEMTCTPCYPTAPLTPPRVADQIHQNQPQIRHTEAYLVDDDVSSEETDESEPLSDSTIVCDHYAHWKRLRSKRGNACFVCRLCAAKWKMPTVQAVNFRAIVMTTPAVPAEFDIAVHSEYHTTPVTDALSKADAESETDDACGPNCQHVSQWKRLRTKRGAAFFVCYECGCKWRTPAPPTQADRRNGWYYHVFPAMLFGFY